MKYIITSFEACDASITVLFENGIMINLAVPVTDGELLSGDELDQYIKGFAPKNIEHDRTEEGIKLKNAHEIRNLVKSSNTLQTFTAEEASTQKIEELLISRRCNIAMLYGTSVRDLSDYEAKRNRLATFASIALSNPEKYCGAPFDGDYLPNDPAGVEVKMREYLDEYALISIEVEGILAHFRDRTDQILDCETPEEVAAIKW